MANIPPPVYAPRDHAQVQPGPSLAVASGSSSALEFAESTSVTLEWRLSGLRAMYDSSKGEIKSKCIKSAVFGDADNLWEVLWYPNSGVQGGEYASLYLSCVPTAQEREQGIGSKWARKGLWWFRFDIKSTVPDERTNKIVTIATKDASDHTFAVKTANWGWQQFAKRDHLFLAPAIIASDCFVIICTIQAQPQPPAGYWLGLGLPPSISFVPANTIVSGNRNVGSGGGLSAWSGGEGASGGVAGGTTAAGGVKKVVPRDLVHSVGSLLDDQLYSDVEFVIPYRRYRQGGENTDIGRSTSPKRIYANKKLLNRCDYFDAMFSGGFKEHEGETIEGEDDVDDDCDMLSDSDEEDEIMEYEEDSSPNPSSGLHLTTTTSNTSMAPRRFSTTGDMPLAEHELEEGDGEAMEGVNVSGEEGLAEEPMEEDNMAEEVPVKREVPTFKPPAGRDSLGPKKTRVVIKDAAWSTWWAVLYWLYTDTIYFAPLSSSFTGLPKPSRHLHPSISSIPSAEPRSRREWIQQWMDERGIEHDPVGPRPVSAKAVYRLADKLDLPALKLRAFQHICSGLKADNIPAEVFSRFSSTFEDVRKIQVAYFLKHWSEIKKSDTMTQIWTQIRLGKHVGFEEVWPLIVGQLDFKPS